MKVPEGWRKATLGGVAEIIMGQSPKSSDTNDVGIGMPFLQGNAEFGFRHPTPVRWIEHPLKMAKAGDILFSVRAPVGEMNIAETDTCIGRGLSAVRAKLADQSFLFSALYHYRDAVRRHAQGSTFEAINGKELRDLEILLPPLPEQRRIAEILSGVDNAIAATQAVIEQTNTVKQSVLSHLLTRGIGHTRFKQSEIGEIPEGWEVLRLESLLANVNTPMRSGPFGSALKKEELVASGIPFLGIDNVHAERFVQEYKRFVTKSKFEELRRFSVRPRDVMITIMGTVGRCCVVPKSVGLALSSKHVWTMTFDQSRCFPELICWQLNYAPWALKEFVRSMQGGVMGAINSSVLRELRLPVPPLEEQGHIFGMWLSFQEALTAEHEKLDRLTSLKFILISDLLTGRKRVSADALSPAL